MTSTEKNLGQFDGQTDIGSINLPGSCEYDAEQQAYSLTGSGADIWRNHDDFHFVWKRLSGDFIVTTWAEFLGVGTNRYRKLGWMARAGLDPAAPYVSAALHGDRAGIVTRSGS